jgi:type I restriction enzyme S subunit
VLGFDMNKWEKHGLGFFIQLFKDYCPNGVEFKQLSTVGTLTRGKRFVHADILEEGLACIHYGEMYTHYGVSTSQTKSRVRPDLESKLRFAEKNDVIIVGAGENIDDIGVGVAYFGEEKVAIHDACFFLHHEMNAKFISHFLRTAEYHDQIKKYVTVGQICAISGNNIGKAVMPVPPRVIQDFIVAILDRFDALTSDLTQGLPAEIAARQRQYEYYRDRLLTFREKSA